MLFVRRTEKTGNRIRPYMFLGLADYVSHQGEKTYRLFLASGKPIPCAFFREATVAAG